MKLIPTWTVESGPKKSGKKRVDPGPDVEAPELDLSDTGKGISKNLFRKIFDPGYTTKKRGWGLGLSLTKRIIEDYHGGKIYVEKSELEKGTTFSVLLNEL